MLPTLYIPVGIGNCTQFSIHFSFEYAISHNVVKLCYVNLMYFILLDNIK